MSASHGKIVFEEDTLQSKLSIPHPTFDQTMPADYRRQHVSWHDAGVLRQNDKQEALQNTRWITNQEQFEQFPPAPNQPFIHPPSNIQWYSKPPPPLQRNMQDGHQSPHSVRPNFFPSPRRPIQHEIVQPSNQFPTPHGINYQHPSQSFDGL